MAARRSLVRELAVDLVMAHLIGLLGVIVLVAVWLHTTVEMLEARDMREVAGDIAAHLNLGGQPALILPPALAARFSSSYGRYSFAVLDGDGHPLMSSEPDLAALAEVVPATVHQPTRFETRRGDALLWGITESFVVGGQPVLIQVAENMNHQDVLMDELVEGFASQAAWYLIPLFAALAWVTIRRMRHRLRPLLHASAQAGDIGPNSAHIRLPTENLPAEVLPLVVAINLGLARLDEALAGQKEFLANAAHELRTPLTVLRTRLSALPEGDLRTALDNDIVLLARLVTQLLRAAELEGLEIDTAEVVDLTQLCRTIAAYLEPAARSRDKAIVVRARDPVLIQGNIEALGQAVTNLIENGLAHTAPATDVEITVGGQPQPFIEVRDFGPGVALEDREKIFQRFWRRDRRKGTGAGLGLSIVARAVEAHHGQVAVLDAAGGGALFRLTFPAHDKKSH